MDLTRTAVTAVKWTASARLLQQALQFCLSVLLMRLLGPEAFGLIGMVMVFTGFATVVGDLSLGAALVQRKEITEQHRSGAFWISLLCGFLIAVGFCAASGLIASFYDTPILQPLTIAISITFVFSGAASAPRAILQRAMRFDRISLIEIGSVSISGLVAAWAALAGMGVWALVVQVIVSSMLSSAMLLFWSGWRPQMVLEASSVKDLWDFGAGLTGFQIVNYWSRSLDNLLIGKFFGSAALGLYSRAYALMLLPISQISRVLSPVLFPAMASIQDDHGRVRQVFLRVLRMLTFLSFPLMLGLAATARPFVLALLGPEWVDIVPLIRILAIAGAVGSLVSPLGTIFTSQGATGSFFRIGVLSSGVTVVAIIVGVYLGSVTAVAWCYLVASFLTLLPNYLVAGRVVGLRLMEVGGAVLGNLCGATSMAGVVVLMGSLLPPLPSFLELSLLVSAGMAVYVFQGIVFKMAGFRDFFVVFRIGTPSKQGLAEGRQDAGPPEEGSMPLTNSAELR